MDPTKVLCQINSQYQLSNQTMILPLSYEIKQNERNFIVKYELETAEKRLSPICVDEKLLYLREEIKKQFNNPNFSNARLKTNPFEYLGNSIFMNRASVKLANIDAVINPLQRQGGYINPQEDTQIFYLDLAGGPGGFSQYLQYRYPNSIGFGMTLTTESNLNWNSTKLDMTRFYPYTGEDGSGNLYTQWNYLVTKIKQENVLGLQLVVADGGFEIDQSTQANLQEFLSSRLILIEFLVALSTLTIGGSFICKVFDTISPFSADLLFLASLCFDRLFLFKPISSRPANDERYFVGQGLKPNIQAYINILIDASKLYTDKLYISRLFSSPLPPSFITWLTTINNQTFTSQINAGIDILDFLNITKSENIDKPSYDLRVPFILWNIPNN